MNLRVLFTVVALLAVVFLMIPVLVGYRCRFRAQTP